MGGPEHFALHALAAAHAAPLQAAQRRQQLPRDGHPPLSHPPPSQQPPDQHGCHGVRPPRAPGREQRARRRRQGQDHPLRARVRRGGGEPPGCEALAARHRAPCLPRRDHGRRLRLRPPPPRHQPRDPALPAGGGADERALGHGRHRRHPVHRRRGPAQVLGGGRGRPGRLGHQDPGGHPGRRHGRPRGCPHPRVHGDGPERHRGQLPL
mmetsp:Transcript_18782/g.46776  ORF Transcript_18782/g.46776 Transcript_18782/m.46776 type:complete len:209 (+) Transcript_18782:324-950(+)